MIRSLDRILQRYGQTVEIGGTVVHAFFQSAADSGKYEPFAITPMGTADDRKWIYLGKTELCLGTPVLFQGNQYIVRNCAGVRLGDKTAYWWAVLTKEGEAAE